MLYHNQPLKSAYLAYQAIATLFVYVPYWLFTSIPHFFKPPLEGRSRLHVISRRIRINCLRHFIFVVNK